MNVIHGRMLESLLNIENVIHGWILESLFNVENVNRGCTCCWKVPANCIQKT